jgi:hypothetical protein
VATTKTLGKCQILSASYAVFFYNVDIFFQIKNDLFLVK